MKTYLKWILLIIGLGIITLFSLYNYISHSVKIYTNIQKVPHKKAALVLGTAKYIAKGKKNYFYTYRIRAAVALWKAGKINAVVVSGDNGSVYYDETSAMYKDLIQAGIPARYISRDYAGFRTLDSVVRAKAIFDLQDYIIISQKFHLERALFIAQSKGQDTIGFAAKDHPNTLAAYRMIAREYLARTKAFLDLYILYTEPKFYGDKEPVHYKAS